VLQAIRRQEDDPREAVRSNVFLMATIVASGTPSAVRIRNISVCGALVEGEQLPTHGAVICLSRGHLETSGEIAWQSGAYRGLRFNEPVDVQAWVKRVGHSGQQEVDQKLAMLRRRGLSHSAEVLIDDWSCTDKLSRISGDLDLLCGELTVSESTVEFGEQLIRLDTIAQRLRMIASAADRS
jgi:hypothetical protein